MAVKGLHFSRTLKAPRALAFKAWTDPKMVQQWWGPKHFTNPVCEMDVRPGGQIAITMRGPDGTDYAMAGEFKEILEPERLQFIAWVDQAGKRVLETLNTVTFEEKDGVTVMTLWVKVQIATDEAAPMLAGMKEGWSGSLDKLVDFFAAS